MARQAAADGAVLQTARDGDSDGEPDRHEPGEIEGAVNADPAITRNRDGSLTMNLPVDGAKTPNGHGTRSEFRFPDFDLTEGGTVTFNVTIEALPDGEVDVNVAQLEEPVPGDAADRDIIQVRLVQSEGTGRGDVVIRSDGEDVATVIRDYVLGTPIHGTFTVRDNVATVKVNDAAPVTFALPVGVATAYGKAGAYSNGPAAGSPADATTTVTVTEASQDTAGEVASGDPVPPRPTPGQPTNGGDPVPPGATTDPMNPTAPLRERLVVD